MKFNYIKTLEKHKIYLIVIVLICMIIKFYSVIVTFIKSSSLQDWADFITILGVIGLLLAFWKYHKEIKENKRNKLKEKLRLVRAIKYQLEVIGTWSSFNKGGYHKWDRSDWIQKEFSDRANPFHIIFELESSFLQNINLLPAIKDLDEEVIEAISYLNQEIISFNTALEEIRLFKYSRPADKNIILHLKLNGIIKDELTKEENNFCKKLVEFYALLHFDIISDENYQRLHYWHKKLKSKLDSLEKDLEKQLNSL